MNDRQICDSQHIIAPSSSALIRAPSWSLGYGADHKDLDTEREHDDDEDEDDDDGSSPHELAVGEAALATTGSLNHHNPLESIQDVLPRISLEIPTVYLTRKNSSSSSYHVYQLCVKLSTGAEWSVYRRYSQFLALHRQLKSLESDIGKFRFPPKKRLNSKASTIVQDRRIKLEEYIRTLNNYIEKRPATNQQLRDFSAGTAGAFDRGSHTASSLSGSTRSDHLDRRSQSNQPVSDRDEISSVAGGASGANDGDESTESSSLPDSAEVTNRWRAETNPRPLGKLGIISLFHNFISLKDKGQAELEMAAQLGS